MYQQCNNYPAEPDTFYLSYTGMSVQSCMDAYCGEFACYSIGYLQEGGDCRLYDSRRDLVSRVGAAYAYYA